MDRSQNPFGLNAWSLFLRLISHSPHLVFAVLH
jgi:hypothetical protein